MATLEAARAEINLDAPQLRVLTCGSVDDGKSTLLGRLLYESNAILDDQLAALDAESRRWGTQGAERDYALLLDGLSAEREQGITIDVAYRYFSTERRSFILIDSPGHEQYTRNMATGASQADLAVILVDARKGLLPQTRRHAFIASLLGIRHAVLAVNKMDLVGFDEARFRAIETAFREIAARLGFASVAAIPLSAKNGDNVATRSVAMPWHGGPSLLEHLETIDVAVDQPDAAFRLPVQLVLRPDAEFRGYAGTISRGTVRPGDDILALPSRRAARVARIVTADGDRPEAHAGDPVTITLDRELDIARGDVLAAADAAPAPTRALRATLLWMADDEAQPGRDLMLLLGPSQAGARLERIRHAVDIESYAQRPAAALALNEIGSVDLALDRELVAAPYRDGRGLGAFILVDRLTHQTVALGIVELVPSRARRLKRPRFWGRPLLAGAANGALAMAVTGELTLAIGLGCANILFTSIFEAAKKRSQ